MKFFILTQFLLISKVSSQFWENPPFELTQEAIEGKVQLNGTLLNGQDLKIPESFQIESPILKLLYDNNIFPDGTYFECGNEPSDFYFIETLVNRTATYNFQYDFEKV